MFQTRELTRINSRKAVLLAESDASRRELQANWAKVKPLLSWVEMGASVIRVIKAFYPAAAFGFGFMAAGKRTSFSGFWSKLSMGWRLWRAISTAWKSF